MKVFVVLFLAISSTAARGSGPYLPSGWRPTGPAFNLPSEEVKPVLNTAQESLVDETEASGSDALREYGPPELKVTLSVNQELPDVATEQNFLGVANNEETAGVIQESADIEANTEQVTAEVEERSKVSDSQSTIFAEEENTSILADIQTTAVSSTVDDQKDDTTGAFQTIESEKVDTSSTVTLGEGVAITEETTTPKKSSLESDIQAESAPEAIPTVLSDLTESVTALNQESTENVVPSATENAVIGRAVEGGNIDAIISLEDEVKPTEVQDNDNGSSKAISGSFEQTPDGFLEYGPPGFLEYGPPKPVAVGRLSTEDTSDSALENNEVRRRRFSPKFRSLKRH